MDGVRGALLLSVGLTWAACVMLATPFSVAWPLFLSVLAAVAQGASYTAAEHRYAAPDFCGSGHSLVALGYAEGTAVGAQGVAIVALSTAFVVLFWRATSALS